MSECQLTTTERYALSQILVCGKIDIHEFKRMNGFMEQMQEDAITELRRKGFLSETLMK